MKFRAVSLDNVRWRSSSVTHSIQEQPSVYRSGETVHVGWHDDGKETSSSLYLELTPDEAADLHRSLDRFLGEEAP